MKKYSISEFTAILKRYPKKKLIFSPTPIQKLTNLSQELEGPEIYIKRDDLTGLAFGGNKSRKLEYIIQDVLDKKADVVITWAGLQSNWCLQTAAAARKFGITSILILYSMDGLSMEYDGNLLLDLILNAEIRIREAEKGKVIKWEEVEETIDEVVREVKEWGHEPYIAPIGGSMIGGSMDKPLGAFGYVEVFLELIEQAKAMDFRPDYVVHATGSGGTQAGLVTGAKAIDSEVKVLGISVSDDKETFSEEVRLICQDTVEALELELKVEQGDILVFDEYTKEGYGTVTKDIADAIRMTALKEGIFLDPVYTGKAMSGLIDLIKKGYFKKEDKIVFIHTGGTAALFPHREALINHLT